MVGNDAHLVDRLLDAIRVASGNPGASWARRPRRIEGGSWADTFRVRLKGAPGLGGDLVARVLPEPDSYEREMLVQQHVAKHGFPAPLVHLGSPPSKELDRAWFLMDFDSGRRVVESIGGARLLWAVAKSNHESPRTLARVTVAIHQIDTDPIATTLAFPKVVGPVLDWLFSRASALADRDLVDRAQRLLATRPRYEGSVLCHGDLHPLNILRSPGRDTIIDWTHAQYDDPLYDVAFTSTAMTLIPIPAPAFLRPLIAAVGAHQARRFIRQYERASKTQVDRARLEWFVRVIALRIRVEAAEWRRLHPLGDPEDNSPQRYVNLFPRYGL
jgi:aminoglycoside phosphotransferase (APT) family kinase protein